MYRIKMISVCYDCMFNIVCGSLLLQNKQVLSELGPVKAQLADVTGQKEALSVEKQSLEAEIGRWKARTSHLIEQCNKADPEEIKRLT